MKRHPWVLSLALIVVLVCAFLVAAQLGRAAGDNPGKVDVTIDNFSFTPASVTVTVGTTVTWTNKDDVPHTVVSDDKTTFRSKALDTDEKYSYTFTKAGKYDYFCSVHPRMTGEIVVK